MINFFNGYLKILQVGVPTHTYYGSNKNYKLINIVANSDSYTNNISTGI